MLARTHSTQSSVAADPEPQLDGFLVAIETAEIDLAEKVSELLSGYDRIEIVVTGDGQGNAMRMLGAGTVQRTEHSAETRRVALRSLAPDGSLFDVLSQGIWAIVDPTNDEFESQLKDSVNRVLSGDCPALEDVAKDPASAGALMSAVASKAEREALTTSNPLSRTEVEILSRIADGQTSRKIAEDLGFHLQTVKNRVTMILNKTNANSRSHAAAKAQANGWIASHPNRG